MVSTDDERLCAKELHLKLTLEATAGGLRAPMTDQELELIMAERKESPSKGVGGGGDGGGGGPAISSLTEAAVFGSHAAAYRSKIAESSSAQPTTESEDFSHREDLRVRLLERDDIFEARLVLPFFHSAFYATSTRLIRSVVCRIIITSLRSLSPQTQWNPLTKFRAIEPKYGISAEVTGGSASRRRSALLSRLGRDLEPHAWLWATHRSRRRPLDRHAASVIPKVSQLRWGFAKSTLE